MHVPFLAFLLAWPADLPNDAWPQWRGPTADSVSPTADLPTEWSTTKNVAWKATFPGWSASTPAIWGDAIFLTSQEDEHLWAVRLDRKTGALVWKDEVGTGVPRRKGEVGKGRFHDEHNMATPSPTTDGKLVWFHFGTGDIGCYDFAGKRVWHKNLTDSFGPYTIWWGHANSLVLVDDLVVSICCQDPKDGGRSYVVALDKRTGEKRWDTERSTGAKAEPADAYTTPLVHRTPAGTELIVFGGNVLNAYEIATGKQLWESKVFSGNRVISGPTLAGDTVFATQGMRGPVYAIKAGGTGDVTKSNLRWSYKGGTPDAACPVVAKGLVFLANNDGSALCLDAETGKEQWKQRLGGAFRATPLVVGDRIYFFAKDGKTTIVAADRSFRTIAENELGEDVMASPAVAGHELYLRTKTHLYRIESGKSIESARR
jgi:outer membrane protein assembly factor BamB